MTNIELVTQPVQVIHARLTLLNGDFTTVDSFTGTILSMSMSVDNTSDIRRTLSLTMTTTVSAMQKESIEDVWLDKIVQIEYGIYDPVEAIDKWFLLGTFVLSDSNYSFGVGELQIDMTLVDLMSMTAETRGSQIGSEVTIKADSEIKAALEATIRDFTRLTKTEIVNFDDVIPYDLEFDKGVYPYEVLKTMVTLLPYYEHFFSREGVYTVRLIPMTYTDALAITADEMDKLIISDNGSSDYSEIANTIEIWGQELDAKYTAKKCKTESKTYHLTIDDTFETLEDGMTVSFTADTTSVRGMSLQIQNTETYPLYILNGDGTYEPIGAGAMTHDIAYCIKYTEQKFILRGELDIHAIAMEVNAEPSAEQKTAYQEKFNCLNICYVVNPASKYAADNPRLGVVKRVQTGGDYDAIYSTQLALERARYDLWKASRLARAKQITCAYAPWLDVNQKIGYRSIVDGKERQYLVEKIETAFDGTMSLTISEFFPLYQWLNGGTWGGLTRTTWGDLTAIKWGNLDEYEV